MNADDIKRLAQKAGFDLCGIAPAEPIPDASEAYQRWIKEGRHAGMRYLERHVERRSDPTKILPEAKSLIVLGLNHYIANRHNDIPLGSGRIARYARGTDYHPVIEGRLQKLIDLITAESPDLTQADFKAYVDYGPFLERAHAVRADLGYLGRNSMLINERFGSWLFLSVIITTIDLEPDQADPARHGSCDECSICIDSCPTSAITEDGTIDANRCLSYHTIEHWGRIPDEFHEPIGSNIFGCDICQEVCPHNEKAVETPHQPLRPESGPGELIKLNDVINLGICNQFDRLFGGTSIERTGLDMILRNARIVRANQNNQK